MPKELLEEQETQSDFDTDAALEEISTDLFRQVGEDGAASKTGEESVTEEPEGKVPAKEAEEVRTSPSEASPDADAPPAQQNSAEVQALGAPDTWTKEALAEWAAVPPRVQQEILKREADMHRGLEEYRSGFEAAKRYDSVIEPYKPILAAENIDPVVMFQNFAGNHYILSRGQPQQKAQLAATLMREYGVDIQLLADALDAKPQTAAPLTPEVLQLRDELHQVKQQLSAREQAERDQLFQNYAKEVSDFAASHPYFDEVAADIELFVKSGDSLQTAYDKAVYANPVTRQKELDRLTAEAVSASSTAGQARADKIAKSTAADLSTSPKPRNGAIPAGTIDETLEETLAAIKARG